MFMVIYFQRIVVGKIVTHLLGGKRMRTQEGRKTAITLPQCFLGEETFEPTC